MRKLALILALAALCGNAQAAGYVGINPATKVSSGALAANLVVSNGATGPVYLQSFEVSADGTLSGGAWWIMIFDAAAAPVDGAVTPAKCYAIPSGTAQAGATFDAAAPAFSSGVVISVSTTGCFTKTASTHAYISGDVAQ